MNILKKPIYIVALVLLILAAAVYFILPSTNSDIDLDTTFRNPIGAEPGTLDPNLMNAAWEHSVGIDAFSGLVSPNAKGEIVPDMAEDWLISNNYQTFTFKLRDSAWSDGTPVTAYDFEYSIKRLLNPTTAADYAELLYIIKGAEEYNQGKSSSDKVQVYADNDNTLRINLTHPAPYFIALLAHSTFLPVPKHVVEKYGEKWTKMENIVSNGAYKIVEWQPFSHIKSVKNPYYYDQQATVETVIYYTQDEPEAVFKRYRNREVDHSLVPSEQMDWIAEHMADELTEGTTLANWYISINKDETNVHYNKAFSSKKVRKALSMAIDRKFIANVLNKGNILPGYGYIPPGLPGYRSFKYDWADTPIEERIKQAKELLAEEGYSIDNPLNIELRYISSKAAKKDMVAVADMWKKIGVIATLVNTEAAVHYKFLNAKDFQISAAGWLGDYAEPSTFLYTLQEHSSANYGSYKSKEFANILTKASYAKTDKERYQLYYEAEKVAMEDYPVITFSFPNSKRLVSPAIIDGFKSNLLRQHPAKYIRIDRSKLKK